MKKTLLIAAAALAVGVITTQAAVYSQNVVGYVNQTIPAHGYQIVGSTLIGGSDVNQTNGDVNVTLINGLISSSFSPNVSSNSTMLYWSGSTFITYYYYNSADATTWINDGNTYAAGWYTTGQDPAPVNLINGKSVFIHNNASVPMTVTTTGNVFGGSTGSTNVSTITAGYNLIGLQVPISTNVVVDANGSPLSYGLPLNLTSSPNPPSANQNDSMLYWNGVTYVTYYYYNSADATTWINDGNTYPAGFYTTGQDFAANPTVNQGFFIKHIGSAINWTNSFIVP